MTSSGTMARPAPPNAAAPQRIEFRTGDEAAAIAARAIGALSDTAPALLSTELSHAFGAALAGVRVVAHTTSRGLAAGLEQLAVQASERVPMVLDVAARAIASSADGGCDHSAIYQALDTGCIVLCARDPQAVYDFNLAAVRIGEHPEVRLPVIVAYDAHATSEAKRRLLVIDDADAVQAFIGPRRAAPTPVDVAHSATFGAPLDEEPFHANRAELSQAMSAARKVIPEVFAQLEALTGRAYPMLEAYRMDEAGVAVVLVNTAAEAAKEAADIWRLGERKAGVLSPNVLRPFPSEELRALLRHVDAVTVGDRADSYGADGGRLALELRAAIQLDRDNATKVVSRVYGLGGKALHAHDAEMLLDAALAASTSDEIAEPFGYHGVAHAADKAPEGLPPVGAKDLPQGVAQVRRDEASDELRVELAPLWKMTAVPGRIAPGHGACPGCGAFPMLHQVYKVLEGDVVTLFQGGCAVVVTAAHGATAHRVNCVHNAAGHGAATLSGLVEAYHERVRAGELPASRHVTFLLVIGDGGLEADLADVVAVAHRNPRMIILEYDNQGRMSQGGLPTASSVLGPRHGDTARILAACDLPYVFTASEAFPEDLMRKAVKAQWHATDEGLAYGKVLSFCPLHWGCADDAAQPVLQAAIDSCAFPLYEVERGRTKITYDPDATGRRRPVLDWLELMDRTAHLADPDNAARLASIQAETDRRWERLKAMHGHPLL